MNDYYIHPSTFIDKNVKIGEKTKIWYFCHICEEAQIGEYCQLGQNVLVDRGVIIKSFCKIQNNVSLYNQVHLEEGVFCGPSCVFTNVLNPRAFIDRKREIKSTHVGRGCTVGANATIVCGVQLGSFSFIGAGSVVIKDVPAHALMVGNPARQIGWMSHAGCKLDSALICPMEKKQYVLENGALILSNPLESDQDYVRRMFKQNNPSLFENVLMESV